MNKKKLRRCLTLPFVLLVGAIFKLVELVVRFFIWLVPEELAIRLMVFAGGKVLGDVMEAMEETGEDGDSDGR